MASARRKDEYNRATWMFGSGATISGPQRSVDLLHHRYQKLPFLKGETSSKQGVDLSHQEAQSQRGILFELPDMI